MIDSEPFIRNSFSIAQKHLAFLETINPDNSSAALRQVLDTAINNKNNKIRKQRIHHIGNTLIFICLGCFFLSFLFTVTSRLAIIIYLGVGTVLIVYGVSYGVINHEVSTSRKSK